MDDMCCLSPLQQSWGELWLGECLPLSLPLLSTPTAHTILQWSHLVGFPWRSPSFTSGRTYPIFLANRMHLLTKLYQHVYPKILILIKSQGQKTETNGLLSPSGQFTSDPPVCRRLHHHSPSQPLAGSKST